MVNDIRNWKFRRFPVYVNIHLTHQMIGYRALAEQARSGNSHGWLGQSGSMLCWVYVNRVVDTISSMISLGAA
jgi:hypothetical protein